MVLFTALIGPYFVDWTSYRESFEREASAYVGRPVTIAGKASVRLLPTPVISFTDIRVGDAAAPDVEMERFRAEVELAPLLSGRVRIIQMSVERPRVNFDLARLAGSGNDAVGWRLDSERISLERLEIVGGSAVVSDSSSGRGWAVEGIDAVVEADSLMGPARITATATFEGKPVEVTAGLGRLEENRSVAAKLSFRSQDYPVTLALDGVYWFPGPGPAKYEGTATVEGVPADSAAPRSPFADFRASGKFELTPAALSAEEMQVSYGATERPLVLVASGKLDFTEEPRFDVTVSARQIDVDRTLGGGAEHQVSIEAAVAALADALPGVTMPPLPGKAHLDAQGVVVGGGVIQEVGIDLSTAEGAWRVDGFSATLPGDTRLDMTGTLGLGSAVTFTGHARLASERPAAFAAWWRGEAGSATKISQFQVEADLDVQNEIRRIANLIATTGAGAVKGSVELKRVPQSDSFYATVDLDADRADLVETRALAELFATRNLTGGTIDQMTLSLRADVLTAGGVEARAVEVDGGWEEGQLNLRRLAVGDLAGARIDAIGSIRDPLGKPSGRIEASIEAADFSGAADFLVSLAPESRIARHLKSVAPILSPVSAEVSAEGGVAGDNLALSLTGSFADTHLTLEANGKGSLDNPASLAGSLKLRADAGDSAQALRQLGLTPLPLRSTPLKLEADFGGALASGGKLALKGTIAGVDLDYSADTSLSENRVVLSGTLQAKSADVDPALLLAGIGVPGVGEGHAASATGRLDVSGNAISVALTDASFAGQKVGGELKASFSPSLALTGALQVETASLPYLVALASGKEPGLAGEGWSVATFAAPLPPAVSVDLGVGAATLDLGAPDPATGAKLNFSLANGRLQLDLTEASFAAGSLTGALTATVNEGEAEMSLRGGLKGGELQAFVWDQSGLPAASGKLDLSFDLIGRGRSLADIVLTLGGSGSFSIDGGRLNSLNGGALTAVMAAAEGDKEPNEEEARETFARLFGSGVLEFGRAAGSFSISNGLVAVPTVSLEGGGTAILAGATLDLNALTLASEWVVRTEGTGGEEAQPSVTMRFSGPIAEPTRQVDPAPLIAQLQSRYLQQQLDNLEEAERQRIEMERQRAAANREATAERRDLEPPAALPPPPEPVEPRPSQSSAPHADGVEIGADLPPPPPAPVQRSAPVQLVPPPPPVEEEKPLYRLLPNGTIVKIR